MAHLLLFVCLLWFVCLFVCLFAFVTWHVCSRISAWKRRKCEKVFLSIFKLKLLIFQFDSGNEKLSFVRIFWKFTIKNIIRIFKKRTTCRENIFPVSLRIDPWNRTISSLLRKNLIGRKKQSKIFWNIFEELWIKDDALGFSGSDWWLAESLQKLR